ncbi:arginine decarboxylase, pyruvoyl-dependent [Candidatus Sumerlaeota bacterium]|nr:arginine decarboxylase, pyruvoyl-dependent [Candidatus Sumerlaeota bacterium]MBI3735001.1 arginine decarboxylase, pyruvoyl-dependent [Candidatus Sumerlaeota bacterium]
MRSEAIHRDNAAEVSAVPISPKERITELSDYAPFVPSRIFLTKGKGIAAAKLVSFEMALRDAGIAHLNLVRVSSIFPPRCRIIKASEGIPELQAGAIQFVVISENSTNEPLRQIAAAVGLAIPEDRNVHGYISEHHSYGETDKKAGDFAEDLAAQMLATTLGLPFDQEKSWDERKEIWKISKKIVRTINMTETARGDKDGKWTTVVAAAVLLP